MMRKIIQPCLVLLVLLFFDVSLCAAFLVTCRQEFSGQMVTVNVPGARSLDEAKSFIRNNPLYGEVHAGSCKSGGAPMQPTETDTDRYGQDYHSFVPQEKSSQECKDVCSGDPRCKAWTYVRSGHKNGPRCYLKDGKPRPTRDECCDSGPKY